MSKGRSKHREQRHLVPSQSNAPRKQGEQPISPQSDSQEKCAASPIDAATLPGRAKVEPSPTDGDQTKNGWHGALDRWKLPIEIVGIFFGIGYAIVTFFQWRDARRSLELDERAWVAPTNICMESKGARTKIDECGRYNPGTPANFRVIYKNGGKTMASRVSSCFGWGTGPQDPLKMTCAGERSAGLIAPNTSFSSSTDIHPLKPEQMTEIGSNAIYVFGTIYYSDIFGKQHWVELCVRTNTMSDAFESTAEFNSCDDCH